MAKYLSDFQRGYIECALWCGVYDEHGEPVERKLDISDLTAEALDELKKTAADFEAAQADDLGAAYRVHDQGYAQSGHDFWWTAAGHGVDFRDRGLGEIGERLTAAARVYNEISLYLGGDGKVHLG